VAACAAVSAPSATPILAGLRIVELGAFIAGPIGTVELAAMGADVIRVDPPGGGIDIKRGPLHGATSLYWSGINQGKRSVTIDTRTEAGRRTVARLIAAPGEGGGILLTNLPVGGWNSYAELRKLRRDLIMVVITGNRDGSTAVDYSVNAGLGFPWVTGPEGYDGPVNHVLPAFDVMTGYLAAAAILAAERHRRMTGEGQLVELSLADVALAVAAHLGYVGDAVLNAQPRGRFGNDVYGTFGHAFRTGDGRHVMVLALTPRQWQRLGEATGMTAALAALEARLGLDFRDEASRWRARREICAMLEPWFAERPLPAVAEAMDAAGALWGPYRTFKQLVTEDPRLASGNEMVAEVLHPGLGPLPTVGSALRFAAAAAVPPSAAPALGQHTGEVLREFGLEAAP
jgi:2-methylfumaryl-CoA isomerase